MYLTLTGLIQLNLIATRNPSFWWLFSKKTAPRYCSTLTSPWHLTASGVCSSASAALSVAIAAGGTPTAWLVAPEHQMPVSP